MSERPLLRARSFAADRRHRSVDNSRTANVSLLATADFLLEPHRCSDAYITKDGLMQAMVTTFDGGALKMKK